jgi:hypothetical protein
MLKTIDDLPNHESVINSAKLIARWLYNHGKVSYDDEECNWWKLGEMECNSFWYELPLS